METIIEEIKNSFQSLKSQCNFEEGKLLVVGCSSSEILGDKIGTNTNKEVGQKVASTIIKLCNENKILLAAQCCEHINRALVVEKKTAEKFNYEIVSVVPKAEAGGSFAASVYKQLKDPVVVEYIKADYGFDIGLTMIGMHMKHVCIPLRIKPFKIGKALVTGAKRRPKLIGGVRAKYE